MIDTCEIRVAVGEVEIPQNQIPPSAPSPDIGIFPIPFLLPVPLPVLVPIQRLPESQMVAQKAA